MLRLSRLRQLIHHRLSFTLTLQVTRATRRRFVVTTSDFCALLYRKSRDKELDVNSSAGLSRGEKSDCADRPTIPFGLSRSPLFDVAAPGHLPRG